MLEDDRHIYVKKINHAAQLQTLNMIFYKQIANTSDHTQ